MGVVILSTVVFILSTLPELTDDIDMILFTNTSNVKGAVEPVERWEEVSQSVIFLSLISLQFSKSNIGLSSLELIWDQGKLFYIFSLQGILALNIIDHATMVFFTAGNIRMQLESRQTQSASHHPPNWIFALKDYSNCDWDK